MIDIIFPIKLQLKILQLEDYEPIRFLLWIKKNLLTRKINNKKDLVITLKLKAIMVLSFLELLIISILAYCLFKSFLLDIVITLFLISQPYILLTVSSSLISLPEWLFKRYLIQKTRTKILSLKSLRVIAITGSYGKSSTKEILYQLLRNKYKVLRTPESYNTILGISKVVDYELDESYDYFICEMAAYHRDDINNLLYMVPPTYGIITGITSQHIERFGNLKNIIRTKFELYDKISNKNDVILNTYDQNIVNEIKRRNIQHVTSYLTAKNISFTKNGSKFEIVNGNTKSIICTALFGYANVRNILGASAVALLLGIDFKSLVAEISYLKPFSNRSNLEKYGNTILVNNTFSSNEAAFLEMLKTAKLLKGKKALITPGLVELGDYGEEIHKRLGKSTRNIFNTVVLVGRNNRTNAFAQGLRENVEFIEDSRKDYMEAVEELKDNFDWIFMENDITENY